MRNETDIVITVYGHKDKIDKIAFSTFYYNYDRSKNAETYCKMTNNMALSEENWVFAKIVSETVPFSLDSLIPIKFEKLLSYLSDRAMQKVIRELNSLDLAKAIKNCSEETKNFIFKNMSGRAKAMLKEDLEYMVPVKLKDDEACRQKIKNIIYHLCDTGEIELKTDDGYSLWNRIR